jgi:hypothetical protein
MREKYEGQGLERFVYTVMALAVIGLLSLVCRFVRWVWKWLT